MTLAVAFFPSLTDLKENPYWSLLAGGLAAQGVQVLPDNPRYLALHWLWEHRGRVQVVHIHYFQDNYAYERTQARLRWVLRFTRNLVAARLLGYRVVWTVHNETPSFPLQPKWVEDLAHLAMARLASAVIVHCQYARKFVARHYGRHSGVYVAPHPNFIGVYPPALDQAESRVRLKLPPDSVVLLCFGQMRPNKGIERLLNVFRGLSGAHLRLVVAGAPGPDPAYVAGLAALASQDNRVSFQAQWIPDDRVGDYYMAADAVVAPFDRVLTSSSVILALSFGRPVIAPAMGCLPELVQSGAGWIYDEDAPGGLEAALRTALATDLAQAGLRAFDIATALQWDAFAKTTLESYGL